MNLLTLILSLLLSTSAFAINDSALDVRHQMVIKKAILKECSLQRTQLKEIRTFANARRIDQGILDFDYITELEAEEWIDQGIKDYYRITIESHYSDSYDHSTKEWGIYYISSITCKLI